MKRLLLTIPLFAGLLTSVVGADEEKPAAERPKIEVCFVLDTTGSMSGLIQAAKDKVWSIANELISTKPAPEIKFGLIGYRDRGDDYVTEITDLSDDIDAIYGKLMKFSANGGGDGPESVNQALNEAVTKMKWSDDKKVLKIIFLVGDAEPHMDYENDVKYADTCKEAVKKDLIINTVQCGADPATTKIWNEIADLSEGKFVAIEQDGGAVAMVTPFDEKIAAVNGILASTVVAYGDESVRGATAGKLRALDDSKSEALAERADFLYKSAPSADGFAGSGRVVDGDVDLVEKLARKELEVENIKEDQLSAELKAMPKEEREKFLTKKLEERTAAQKEIEELLKKRSEFIAAEKAKLREKGEGDSFDLKVGDTIREQAAKKGILYK